MAFTFTTKNNKKYTYPNVGERNGFVAEKGKGNLSWKEVKAYREVGRTTARKLSNQLRFLCQRNIQYSFDLPYDTGNLQRSIVETHLLDLKFILMIVHVLVLLINIF